MIVVKSNTSKVKNYFVVLQQNKAKCRLSSQGPRLNQKLIYAIKRQLKINFKA